MPDAIAADSRHDRLAGFCLGIAAAGTMLAMAHHPTGAHGGAGGGGDFIHGAMILLLAAMTYGFFHFALRRGIGRPEILAGVIAYALSVVAHLGAATINGFVVPALAGRGGVGHDSFLLAWEANQALARLGVYGTGLAFILWSIDFLRRGEAVNRLIGVAGLIAGALPALMLFAGKATMDIRMAFLIYSMHAGWSILVAVQLVRSRI